MIAVIRMNWTYEEVPTAVVASVSGANLTFYDEAGDPVGRLPASTVLSYGRAELMHELFGKIQFQGQDMANATSAPTTGEIG